MRALRIVGEREIIVRERPEPVAGPGEVLVQIKSTAICGSDLHPYRHPGPAQLEEDYIPGHEPCGIISAVGPDVGEWSVGDSVVVYFRRSCGQCHYCRLGRRNLCANRRPSYGHAPGADGSHADYMLVEVGSLMRLPDYLNFLDGAIISCQAGTAFAPLSRLGVSGRDLLIVSGLGPVGLLATMFGEAMGARVIGIDPSSERRALAEKLGARSTLDPIAGPVGDQLRDIAPELGTKLIETSGSNIAHAAIGELLRPLSTAAIVGLGSANFTMPLMRLVHRELTVFGTSIYPDSQFDEICTFVRDRGVKLGSVVTHTFTLDQAPEAFRVAESATSGKVAFTFD